MQSISTDDLRTQSVVFARDMIAFLEEENQQLEDSGHPFREPREMCEQFEITYRRFVSKWRLVTVSLSTYPR
jgi:hypothetical protein